MRYVCLDTTFERIYTLALSCEYKKNSDYPKILAVAKKKKINKYRREDLKRSSLPSIFLATVPYFWPTLHNTSVMWKRIKKNMIMHDNFSPKPK